MVASICTIAIHRSPLDSEEMREQRKAVRITALSLIGWLKAVVLASTSFKTSGSYIRL
jgi:hypothetical protein